MNESAVVVPNLNGKESIEACVDSLLQQKARIDIVVVDNGSTDGSTDFLNKKYGSKIVLLQQTKNLGFAGGVNVGINYAIKKGYRFVALFNNDAVADSNWTYELLKNLELDSGAGIATGKIISSKDGTIDSTGDMYTTWGLPYPRGRGESSVDHYDKVEYVFAASGGASLYRVQMLQSIGLFDEDFFAYYEDVDLSFRAQLAGWKIIYVPSAIVHHQIGATSSKIKGFTTYQTLKNLPWLKWKNVPGRYFWRLDRRFTFAYFTFFVSAILRGQGWYALKGLFMTFLFTPKKLKQRRAIQSSSKVTAEYIWGIMTHDLPPNAHKLRRLRSLWWKLTLKKNAGL